MRIEKWGFLLSYAIYLVFCLFFAFFTEDQDAVNSMIFSITTASTAFAISDILFTKYNIDSEESDSLFGLYRLTGHAKKIYIKRIIAKYNKKAEKIILTLMDLFEDNDKLLEDFLYGKLSESDKKEFFTRVASCSDDELNEFITNYLKLDNSDIVEMVSEDESEDMNIYKQNSQRKRQIIYRVASGITVLGLVFLLVIITMRIRVPSYANNAFTIIAFLAVIINLILKEYYKASSLKKIKIQTMKLIKDLEEHNKS